MYGVTFIQDGELAGQDWALVRTPTGTQLFICESEVTPEVLEQAWAAYRRSVGIIPEQRGRTAMPRSVAASG